MKNRSNNSNRSNNVMLKQSCEDCKKVHVTCRVCGGQHKCTTRCNACKDLGHIKACCPKNRQRSSKVAVVEMGERAEERFISGEMLK